MAAVKLEQYLASIIDAARSDTNEVKIKPGNSNFDLFIAFLENRNTGIHRYQTTGLTILYEAKGSTKVRINSQDFMLNDGNIIFLQKKSNYEILKPGSKDILVKLEFDPNIDVRNFFDNLTVMNNYEKKLLKKINTTFEQKRLLGLNGTLMSESAHLHYFSSLVKQKTGKSFVEHVDERRMLEARSLLARPDISVKEIITRVGYSGKSFFYKKFSEYYHETPVQMRAELFRQANINLK